MKKRLLFVAIGLLIINFVLHSITNAQSDQKKKTYWKVGDRYWEESEENSRQIWEILQRAVSWTATGPAHDIFKEYTGNYDFKLTVWAVTNAEPVEIEATGYGISETIYEGSFLITTSKCRLVGRDIESTQIIGYDRIHDEYVFISYNNYDTLIKIARGPYYQGGWHFRGETLNPHTNEPGVFEIRQTHLVDDTRLTETYFQTEYGTWRKYSELRTTILRKGNQ